MQEYVDQVLEKGYCRIPQLYSAERMQRALDLVTAWYEKTREAQSENVPYLNRDQLSVYNLQNKEWFFLELLFGSSEITQIMMGLLNDRWFKQIPAGEPNFILRSYSARSSNVFLPMHIDSFIPYVGAYPISVQVAIILEDQNRENGSTLLVPGSHQAGEYVEQSAVNDAIATEAKAGDIAIWDSRIWHGASANTSDRTRWALLATFTRWWIKQSFNMTRTLPQVTYERLTDNQKAILGFCSMPWDDEMQGIDMKRGYDSLRPRVADYYPSIATGDRSAAA